MDIVETIKKYTSLRGGMIAYQSLWDTVLLPAYKKNESPAIRCHFFAHPIGFNLKSREDTNMELPFRLPKGNEFYCTGFEVFFLPTLGIEKKDRETTVSVLSRGLLEFTVGNLVCLRMAPLAALPPSFPMYAAYDDKKLLEILLSRPTEASGELVKRKESPRGFEICPVLIKQEEFFAVTISFDDLRITRPGKLGVIMNGYIVRSFQ